MTTIQTPLQTQPASRNHLLSRLFVGGTVAALAVTAVVQANRAGLLPASPSFTAAASCQGGRSTIDVEVRHMPGRVATVTVYTDGDTWAGGGDVRLYRRAGLYTGYGAPAGVVNVEVTPQRQGMLPVKRVAVPDCGRSS